MLKKKKIEQKKQQLILIQQQLEWRSELKQIICKIIDRVTGTETPEPQEQEPGADLPLKEQADTSQPGAPVQHQDANADRQIEPEAHHDAEDPE